MKRLSLTIAPLLLATLCAPARAQEPSAQCSVLEVQATHEKKGTDPKLDRFKSKLAKPPFSAYDTFKLLKEQSVTVERQKPASVPLTNGKLTLLFKEKMAASGGKFRLRFEVDLDSKEGRRVASSVVTFDSGDGFTIGGEEKEGAAYVVALSCTAS